jgi:hypothetical protein
MCMLIRAVSSAEGLCAVDHCGAAGVLGEQPVTGAPSTAG